MKQFTVIDGQYDATFSTIEEARKDAQVCMADESYSGHVEIRDAETGKVVEVVDTDGAGSRR